MSKVKEKLIRRLNEIYPEIITEEFQNRLWELLILNKRTINANTWTEKDSFLITYGDTLKSTTSNPLQALKKFSDNYLKGVISTIHILPFFPYSSDDGFSVIDFEAVNPQLGTWNNVEDLSSGFKLMFDLVINHVSSQSKWFDQFLKNQAPGKDFILVPPSDFDTAKVIRPRSSPLLTAYKTKGGEKQVWTTFSADQIDLNYWNPELLLEMIRIFLLYVERGASVIRLDAIAFLWKRTGTACLHEKRLTRLLSSLETWLIIAALM